VTIEDAAELKLNQPHVVRLEARPRISKAKGKSPSATWCATRCACGRIASSSRGAWREALDMLQAMNTGHEGSISTIHATAARRAGTVGNDVMMAGMELPSRAIREQITAAIHLTVQVARW